MDITSGQKQVIKQLYKNGGKIEKSKSHIHFLSKCLEFKVIPSNFKLKNTLPGNTNANQEKLNKISFESINDEKQKHSNILIGANIEFEKAVKQLKHVFDDDKAAKEFEKNSEAFKKGRKK